MPRCLPNPQKIYRTSSIHFLREFYEANFSIAEKAKENGSPLELSVGPLHSSDTKSPENEGLRLMPISHYSEARSTLSSISLWVNEKLKACCCLPKEYRFIQFFRQYAEAHNERVRRYNAMIASWSLLRYLDESLANFNPSWSLKAPEIDLKNLWTPSEREMRYTARLAVKQTGPKQLTGKNRFIFSNQSFEKTSYLKTHRFFLNIHESSCQGRRPLMENRHLITYTDDGDVILAIFDGHSDQGSIAEFLKNSLVHTLQEELKSKDNDPFEAFQTTAKRLNQEARALPNGQTGGSTAVVCLIRQDFVYTATIGDSLAYHLRKRDNTIAWAPLSLKLDWHSEREQQRYQKIKGRPISPYELARERVRGLKVSRSIGDAKAGALISCRPKVTMHGLKGGDYLLLACDGLYDYCSISDIAATFDRFEWAEGSNFAKELQQKALYQGLSLDNITIIAVQLTDVP